MFGAKTEQIFSTVKRSKIFARPTPQNYKQWETPPKLRETRPFFHTKKQVNDIIRPTTQPYNRGYTPPAPNEAQRFSHIEKQATIIQSESQNYKKRGPSPIKFWLDQKCYSTKQPSPQQSTPAYHEIDVKEILRTLAKKYNKNGKKPFKNVLLVGMQHMLKTTVDMFKVMEELGLECAVVGGKNYSNNEPSIDAFKNLGPDFIFIESTPQVSYGEGHDSIKDTTHAIWIQAMKYVRKKRFKLVLILDDGGDLILTTRGELFKGISNGNLFTGIEEKTRPEMVMALEQTQSGMDGNPRIYSRPFPIGNAAGSFVKGAEYSYVAQVAAKAVIDHIKKKVAHPKQLTIGIIGYGTMGKAVEKIFKDEHYTVLLYDKKDPGAISQDKTRWMPSSQILLSRADIIIECTGSDITANENNLDILLHAQQEKVCVSLGSKDNGFRSLLLEIASSNKVPHSIPDPLEDIEYNNYADNKITIIRGGFPVNFNNQAHSVSPEHIWMTRALLLLSCIMCTNAVKVFPKTLKKCAKILSLDAEAQRLIIYQRWQDHPDEEHFLPLKGLSVPEQDAYIMKHSSGTSLFAELIPEEKAGNKTPNSFPQSNNTTNPSFTDGKNTLFLAPAADPSPCSDDNTLSYNEKKESEEKRYYTPYLE